MCLHTQMGSYLVEGDLQLPAQYKPFQDLGRVRRRVGTEQGLSGEGALGVSDQHPANEDGGLAGAVPDRRLGGEFHGAGDAVVPGHSALAQAAGCPTDPGAGGRQSGDSYAVLDLLHCCQSLREPVTLIARLRLDAALYAPAPPRQPGQNGRPPLKGPRRPPLKVLLEQTDVTWASAEVAWYDGITRAVELTSQTAVWYRSGKPPVLIRWVLIRDPQGSFATQALLCTDPAADPTQILEWFVLRWQLEVTFHEVRTHLGVETQRQWSDLAIARTTPALLGLFSWTTLAAHALQKRHPMTQRKAAWYDKPSPTFVDAIALVRRHLWLASEGFSLSVADPDIQELPVALYHRLVDSLAYAA